MNLLIVTIPDIIDIKKKENRINQYRDSLTFWTPIGAHWKIKYALWLIHVQAELVSLKNDTLILPKEGAHHIFFPLVHVHLVVKKNMSPCACKKRLGFSTTIQLFCLLTCNSIVWPQTPWWPRRCPIRRYHSI